MGALPQIHICRDFDSRVHGALRYAAPGEITHVLFYQLLMSDKENVKTEGRGWRIDLEIFHPG